MASNPVPAWVPRPGHLLRRELEARGWSNNDLAGMLGRPVRTVAAMLVGDQEITPGLARGLGQALGTSAELWLGLESRFRTSQGSPGRDGEERCPLPPRVVVSRSHR